MATQTKPAAASAPNYLVPFITITALFCIFGFITSLNNALVPQMKSIFDLSYGKAMLTTSAFFLAYLFFSIPSSWLIEAIGYKRTIVISLFVQVVGAMLFIPAAIYLSFAFFLTAIFILAAGVTALQTAANPYVSILGPEHSAPARLTLAQAFNALGQAAGPAVVGWFILTDPAKVATKAAIANTVQAPFMAIAGGLLLLGLAVMFMRLPAITRSESYRPGADSTASTGRSIWSYRHTVLATLGIFFYVGVEVTLAGIAINYFLAQGLDGAKVGSFFASLGNFGAVLTNFFGPWTSVKIAGILVSLYWLGSLVGRFLGTWLLTFIRSEKLLTVFGFLGVALMLVSMFSSGPVAIWSLVFCGFANSIMFPNIFALGIAGLGPMTSKGSGLIVTACFGGAVIPPIYGALADKIEKMYAIAHDPAGVQDAIAHNLTYHSVIAERVGIQYAFIVPILCYLYVAYFGLSGYKPTSAVKA
jgi:FHS family L-fucose permease-like MFS transporter